MKINLQDEYDVFKTLADQLIDLKEEDKNLVIPDYTSEPYISVETANQIVNAKVRKSALPMEIKELNEDFAKQATKLKDYLKEVGTRVRVMDKVDNIEKFIWQNKDLIEFQDI